MHVSFVHLLFGGGGGRGCLLRGDWRTAAVAVAVAAAAVAEVAEVVCVVRTVLSVTPVSSATLIYSCMYMLHCMC